VHSSIFIKRGLIGLVVGLTILIAVTAAFVAAVDAGFFRGGLIRLIAARVGRPIEVQGAFRAHLFSRYPQITAEHVVIGNPPWTPPGRTAEIGELSMVLELPGFHRRFGIESLSMTSTTLTLVRDASGHANWQWTNPDYGAGASKMSIVRSVSVPNAHVTLDDARRHLQFDGTVSAETAAGDVHAVHIEGTGQLNGRAASFELTGDPLATASHETPYRFSFSERSSGSRLEGHGFLPRPFDFGAVETTFDAAGADLKDLYFLTGVSLINTGSYRLSGKMARNGLLTRFTDLAVSTGQSDVRGTLSIDSTTNRPKLAVDLNSELLHMADLGARAAGRARADTGAPLLLSNTSLSPMTLRRGDAMITFHARRIDVGRLPLEALSAQGTIDQGILTVSSLSADILGGKLQAHGRLDANKDPPVATVDIKIADLQLAQIHRKAGGPPPVEGPMQLRIAVSGKGSSVHQVAATANGTVTAVVTRGAVRDSLAELTGIDLRGLGLLLAKDKRETELRCAVGVFKDEGGTLTAQNFVADTEPVLITGSGQIHFDSEALDLELQGHPKSLRLFRWHSPVLVKGTLSRPAISIEAHKLEIVDPGKAKDADCAALIASVNAEDAQRPRNAAER
jgi:AsmA family protein